MKSNAAILVFCSVPDLETGRKLADVLLEKRAAACVTILPGAESHYVWQGKREKSDECVLLVKAVAEGYDRIEQLLRENHPYECPEIVAVGVERGYAGYLNWLAGR